MLRGAQGDGDTTKVQRRGRIMFRKLAITGGIEEERGRRLCHDLLENDGCGGGIGGQRGGWTLKAGG